MIMLYKPYQLKHLNFPTYLFAHPAFTEIANCTSGRTTTTTNPDIFSMKFVTYIWPNRTWTCNSLALAKRVPSYTISQYNIRLYSSNHNIYGNGYEDYNIFYQGLILSGRRGGIRTHTGMILSHLSAADWITRPYFERDWYHLTLSSERRTCQCNHFVVSQLITFILYHTWPCLSRVFTKKYWKYFWDNVVA